LNKRNPVQTEVFYGGTNFPLHSPQRGEFIATLSLELGEREVKTVNSEEQLFEGMGYLLKGV